MYLWLLMKVKTDSVQMSGGARRKKRRVRRRTTTSSTSQNSFIAGPVYHIAGNAVVHIINNRLRLYCKTSPNNSSKYSSSSSSSNLNFNLSFNPNRNRNLDSNNNHNNNYNNNYSLSRLFQFQLLLFKVYMAGFTSFSPSPLPLFLCSVGAHL